MSGGKGRTRGSGADEGVRPTLSGESPHGTHQWVRYISWFLLVWLCAILAHAAGPQPASFRFVLLGDRTGEARQGVYEEALREAAQEHPAFLLTVGDTIQGLVDATAESEWKDVERLLAPYRKIPLYLTPGNHDIWSPASEKLYVKYSGRPIHYGFDYGDAHFTILDNSRSDDLPESEMAFLRSELEAHAAQPVKFIVSHRPSWIAPAALGITEFELHRLAKKYGVQYVIAGHLHQMVHMELDGVTYLSMPSAGGHLRMSMKYEDGWFFAYTVVEIKGRQIIIQVHELKPPFGSGRITSLSDWGKLGLVPIGPARR